MLIMNLSELFTAKLARLSSSAQPSGAADDINLEKLYRMARGHDSLSPELSQELQTLAGRK